MEVWAWGANNYGQLGVDSRCEQIDSPKKISLPSECTIINVCQIAGGGGHTLLVANSQRLYGTGWNNRGQLGLSNQHKDVETFVEVNFMENSKGKAINKIACGWDFSLILLSDGTVFGCGSNSFGQLGLKEEDIKNSDSFIQILALAGIKIVDIACGMRHSLFLDEGGNIYATGCGKKGQLGLGDKTKKLFTPTKIPRIPSAYSVHCGQHFSAVVVISGQTSFGEIFMFGDNKYHQVSNLFESTIFEPTLKDLRKCVNKLTTIDDINVVSCGWTHVVVLLKGDSEKKTKIVTWGRNNYGQLGSCSAKNTEEICVVELPETVTTISSGYEHVLAVTEKGNIYAWGWNEHSNCGMGDPKENVNKAQMLPVASNKKILNCYAGSAHSFALLQTY